MNIQWQLENIIILFLLSIFIGGCQGTPHLVKRSQMLMGTVVHVTAVAPDKTVAQDAANKGLKEIRRLEELLSTWIPISEISRVNAAAGVKTLPVSTETLEVVKDSLHIAKLTEGGFNIAVGPAVDVWNVSGEGHVPGASELEGLHSLTDLSQVYIDEQQHILGLSRSGMRLDVGGIGKGFAADLAAGVMQEAGATAGVVAISGDIKTFGRMPNGRRFVFGIQHPRKEQGELLGTIDLENEAVSTAGDYQRFFMKEGIRYHHILDPVTLQPARECQSVTVIAKTGVMADGLDTGIFVMGPEKGMALIESLTNVEGVIVDREGRISVSSGLKHRVKLNPQ